jgi:hypothetical protein
MKTSGGGFEESRPCFLCFLLHVVSQLTPNRHFTVLPLLLTARTPEIEIEIGAETVGRIKGTRPVGLHGCCHSPDNSTGIPFLARLTRINEFLWANIENARYHAFTLFLAINFYTRYFLIYMYSSATFSATACACRQFETVMTTWYGTFAAIWTAILKWTNGRFRVLQAQNCGDSD